MHTTEVQTAHYGVARIHHNADFSGPVLISWFGGTTEIPGEVFVLLALKVFGDAFVDAFLRRDK